MKRHIYVLVGLFALMGLSACGGGGGGGDGGTPPPPVVSDLAGTWAGSYEYLSSGSVHVGRLEVVVSNDGNIADIRRNGSSLGLTGTMQNIPGTLRYEFKLSNGTEGGFLVDASKTHAGFLDDYGSFGAVQKGGSTTGVNYAINDVLGAWSGYTIVLDSNGYVIAQGPSSATVDSFYVVTGTDYDGQGFSGDFASLSTTYGYFDGDWMKGNMGGYLSAYLTPDKQFSATYACDGSNLPSTAPDLSYCTYSIWDKQ